MEASAHISEKRVSWASFGEPAVRFGFSLDWLISAALCPIPPELPERTCHLLPWEMNTCDWARLPMDSGFCATVWRIHRSFFHQMPKRKHCPWLENADWRREMCSFVDRRMYNMLGRPYKSCTHTHWVYSERIHLYRIELFLLIFLIWEKQRHLLDVTKYNMKTHLQRRL